MIDKKIIHNIIKGTSATTIGTIVTMGFHFISIYFLARYLTVKEFGFYALIFSISNLLNLLSSLGLEISIVKHIAEGSPLRNIVLRPILKLKTLSTFVVTIIFLLFYLIYLNNKNEELWKYTLYITIIFILGSYRDLFYRVLQGINFFKNYVLVQITTSIFRVVMILISIFFVKFSFENLLIIEILTIFLALLLQFYFIPFKSLLLKKDKYAYISLFRFSFPLYINSLITFAYDRIGIFLLGIFMSASSVALYDISSKIPNALQGVINSYIIVFFPNISTLFNKEDKNEAQQLIDKSLLYLSFLITVCILFYFIWSNEIINLFYSEKYLKAVIPTLIMLFAILFNTLSNILGYSIVSAGFAKIPMKVNGVSVIIGLISNFLLIKQFNYIGAALSTVIINLFSTFFYSFYINKINLIKLNYSPAKPIFISIIIVITSYIFPDNFFIRIGGLILFLILNWGLLNEVRYFSTNIFNKVKILK